MSLDHAVGALASHPARPAHPHDIDAGRPAHSLQSPAHLLAVS